MHYLLVAFMMGQPYGEEMPFLQSYQTREACMDDVSIIDAQFKLKAVCIPEGKL